jgi:NADH:ubiquinone oxidoreductase subunit E
MFSPTLRPVIKETRTKYGDRVTIELVNCLDGCTQPPAVTINGKLIFGITPEIFCDEIERAMREQLT